MPGVARVGQVQILHKRFYFFSICLLRRCGLLQFHYTCRTEALARNQQALVTYILSYQVVCVSITYLMLHICQSSFKQKLVCLFCRSIFLPNKRRSVHLVKKFSPATSVANGAVSLHYPALPFAPTARENVCSS